ncbi:hypothetical protein SAMN04515666_108159 [Bosea lupini]|uniref:DUF6894 domain-containing protein n=1 Tax=Bosea lupini TaxID=1036779 RepID=A0A1H7WG24_9HYPH|nr:hypothetical protein [Bosea lupini]SEM20451.1 hypothetical protein SAMN04515666_108159 [Bosea lupini]
MPKYRFMTDDGDTLDLNPDWLDFPDDKAAIREAQRALADMARDSLPDGPHRVMRVVVEVVGGGVVYQASLEFNGEASSDMRAKANAGFAHGNGKLT